MWTSRSLTPDFKVAGDTRSTGGRCSTKRIAETDIHPARLEITVEFSLGTLDVRRIYRICADTPAIACDTYLKGSAAQLPESRAVNAADRKNIESTADMQSQPVAATLDRFNPGGFRWHTRMRWSSRTSRTGTTTWSSKPTSFLLTRKNSYRGNLLFARNAENGRGLSLPEGSPRFGRATGLWRRGLHGGVRATATATGPGATEKDLREGEWVKAYGMRPRESGRAENSNSRRPCGATRKIYGSMLPGRRMPRRR